MSDSILIFFFWIFLAGTVLIAIAMQWSERNLRVSNPDYAKNFVVRMQFAKSEMELKAMFRSVGGKDALGFNLGIDYAYMVFFYGFIAIFCFLLTKQHPNLTLRGMGKWGSLAMLLPYLADCFENYCLARWSFRENWNGPFGLYYFAVRLKWAIAGIVGLFCLVMLVWNLLQFGKVFVL